MVHPGGKLKTGRSVRFGEDTEAEIVEVVGGGLRRGDGTLSALQLRRRYGHRLTLDSQCVQVSHRGDERCRARRHTSPAPLWSWERDADWIRFRHPRGL